MLTADDLAALEIRRVIFHDVPRNLKGQERSPVLSEIPTELDTRRTGHLKSRLIRALGSRAAYAMMFKTESASPVPNLIRNHTAENQTVPQFVKMSQVMANYLFERQIGAISPGLLAVIEARIGLRRSVAVLKLEREEGARLEQDTRGKKKTFSMAVLDDLVLTGNTKLFKNALFVRTGKGDDEFDSLACDNQRSYAASTAMAQFWETFLGCKLKEEPRVTTKKFFEAALGYLNQHFEDPVELHELYGHLHSQLTAIRGTLEPRTFIEEYLPKAHRQAFENHLRDHGVSLLQFPVDVSDISNQLKRKTYYTRHGASVTVPADETNIKVAIDEHGITVVDAVKSVGSR